MVVQVAPARPHGLVQPANRARAEPEGLERVPTVKAGPGDLVDQGAQTSRAERADRVERAMATVRVERAVPGALVNQEEREEMVVPGLEQVQAGGAAMAVIRQPGSRAEPGAAEARAGRARPIRAQAVMAARAVVE